jgi:hypothetical protein
MPQDSDRAWGLLTRAIEEHSRAIATQQADSDRAWREYREDCRRFETALTGLRAEIAALNIQHATTRQCLDALKRQATTRPPATPTWQKLIWTAGAIVGGAVLARLVGVPGAEVGALIRWLTGAN